MRDGRKLPSSKQLSVLLFLAYAALVAVFQGVANILLPALIGELAPGSKVSTLALVSTTSAFSTIIALLSGGAISDRTKSRWGRRTPSLMLSCLATVLLLFAMSATQTLGAVFIVMALLWFSANFYQAVLLAVLPDRIAPHEQGMASSAIGLAVPVGLFLGVNISARSPTPLVGYLSLAALLTVATVALVVLGREASSLAAREKGDCQNAGLRASLLSAFSDRDFSLTFASRFLIFLAYYTVSGYLLYALQDYVGVGRLPSSHNPAAAVSLIMSCLTVAWLCVSPLTGYLSDRVGHTPLIVSATSISIGIVMLIPAFSPSWEAMVVFGAGLGITFGVYFAIDLKLAAMVLSSPEHAGRDLGLLVIAGSGPTVLAPAIAAAIITAAGFPALFYFGAGTAVLGGLCASFIQVDG